MNTSSAIREPAVAGLFYPDDPDELRSRISELLDRVPPVGAHRTAVALVSPHAGYDYSGYTAAHAYKLLGRAQYTTVVIVSPSHREYFDGVSVYPGGGYRTPLGVVPVDESLRREILGMSPLIRATLQGHRQEHALEVQLPFLQQTIGTFSVLPLVMGDQRSEYCTELGEVLGKALHGKDALLVASTDLSHFHPSDVAESLDRIIMRDVAAFDPERLLSDLHSDRAEACGGGPTAAVLIAARRLGAEGVSILHHSTSGDTTGDMSSVVGYFSAVAVRRM